MNSHQTKLLQIFLNITLIASSFWLYSCSKKSEFKGKGRLTVLQEDGKVIFPDEYVGKFIDKKIQIINDGMSPVTIGSMKILENQGYVFSIIHSPGIPFVVEAGKENARTIVIRFEAKSNGYFEGRIQLFPSNTENVDTQGYFYIALKAKGLAPIIQIQCQPLLLFGTTGYGEHLEKKCEIRNRGDQPLTIKSAFYVKKLGNQNDFSILSPSLPIDIPPIDTHSATFTIKFSPQTTTPTTSQGTFYFNTNLENQNKKRLKLNVLGSVSGACQISFSRTKLSFTSKAIGSIRIENKGPGVCLIKKILIQSSQPHPFQLTQIPRFNFRLLEQKHVTVLVAFHPLDEKKYSETIWVESNDSTKPKTAIQLEGQLQK